MVTQAILTTNLAATNTMADTMASQHAFVTGMATEINHLTLSLILSVSLEGVNSIPIMVDIKRLEGEITNFCSIQF